VWQGQAWTITLRRPRSLPRLGLAMLLLFAGGGLPLLLLSGVWAGALSMMGMLLGALVLMWVVFTQDDGGTSLTIGQHQVQVGEQRYSVHELPRVRLRWHGSVTRHPPHHPRPGTLQVGDQAWAVRLSRIEAEWLVGLLNERRRPSTTADRLAAEAALAQVTHRAGARSDSLPP